MTVQKKFVANLQTASIDDDTFDNDTDNSSARMQVPLSAALTPRLRRRIAHGDSVELVLQVPGRDLVVPLAAAAKRRFAGEILAEDGGSKSSPIGRTRPEPRSPTGCPRGAV
jgi:hypothetical protein